MVLTMPCDCDNECESGGTLERLTKSASTVIGARVTNTFARGLAEYCSANGCTQSGAIRVALAKLAKASDDPEQQLAALLDVLGITDDPSVVTTKQITDAVAALLDQHAPEGDTTPDPGAAAADLVPPKPGKPATPAVAASKLSKEQAAACVRKGLQPTAANFAALCKSMIRTAGKEPARAAAPARLRGDVAKLSKEVRAYAKQNGIDLQDMADRVANAVKR
jgi:hypothetical protein